MANILPEIEDFFTEDVGGALGGIGNAFGGIGDVFTGFVSLFKFIFFLINNFIDFIYGSIVFTLEFTKELVEMMPYFLDIIANVIDMIDYLMELVAQYWEVGLAMIFMIPAYVGMFFVINRLNSIFD